LALTIFKPHLTEGIRIKSLPADISIFPHSKYRRPTANEDIPQEPKRKKCGKLGICGQSKDVSSIIKM
jgi:hypothetical protein